MNPSVMERGLMPLSFISWPPQLIHARVWLVVLFIAYLVSVGSVLVANRASGRRGHGTRTINEVLVAGQLTILGYYIRIGVTSELDWDQRWRLVAAALLTGALFVPVGMRYASAKHFLKSTESGHNVTWKVLGPNIGLATISVIILFWIAPRLPQPQLTVRTPSGKPEHVFVENVLPSERVPYDGAPLYVLDHVRHLRAVSKLAGAYESEKLDGSGHFEWVLTVPNDFRNFSVSVRTAYLVNDDMPRPFQVLQAVPKGEPPYHEIAVTVPESHPGDRILVVVGFKQIAPGNPMPEDARKMLEPRVE